MATPARAIQAYWSRLLLLRRPVATSLWNSPSQNCVPACTLNARYLFRGGQHASVSAPAVLHRAAESGGTDCASPQTRFADVRMQLNQESPTSEKLSIEAHNWCSWF